MLDEAQRHYTDLERRNGVRCLHPLPLMRIFASHDERTQWMRAAEQEPLSGWLSAPMDVPSKAGQYVATNGAGIISCTAWLDVPAMLDAQRRSLEQDDGFTERILTKEDLERIPGGVRVGDRSAPLIVRCLGPFEQLPGMVPVRGEVLTIRADLPEDRIIHRGVFALPLSNGLHRVGSTFAWDGIWDGPAIKAREELLDKLRGWYEGPLVVEEQLVGVRPTSRDRRPILGRTEKGIAVLNGLGSRGALLAPWCARHLADHLLDGMPLDPEVDAGRFMR